MKKIILSAAVSAISAMSFAQSYGIQAGGNLASLSFKSSGLTISTSSKFGFLIGAVGEIPVSKSVDFRPELNYIQKGGKITIPGSSESSTTLNYLELPLNVVYNLPAGDGNVFLGGGPSFGLGLSGKDKSKDLESGGSGTETTTDIKFDGKKDATDNFEHLKAIDFGINLIGGYKLANGLFFNVGYSFGLSNISVETDETAKNNGLSFKVGYLFNNGKKKAKK